MKYNVLLIKPISKKRYQVTPDFGIGYVATALKEDGNSVTILDCPKEQMDFEGFEKYLRGHEFEVIGFKIFSSEVMSAKKQIEIIRKVSPSAKVFIGGPHASGTPMKTFEQLKPDYLFVGEAEVGFSALLRNDFKKPEESPGLVWKDKDTVKCNQPYFELDVDKFGMPAWDLLQPNSYPDEVFGIFVRQFPSVPIITSRGCPYPCTFCAGKITTGKRIRRRSIEKVIEEIRFLIDNFGVKDFCIVDDNFTLFKPYVIDFCKSVIDQKLNISWSCPNGVRLDSLDKEMLVWMEKSGCYSIAVGVESGSQRILEDMHKILTIDKIKEKISLIKQNTKIKVTGFFIIGYPAETREDVEKTISLATELDIDRAAFSIFSPLPGSPIYYRLLEEKKIDEDTLEWDKFTIDEAIMPADGISVDELKGLQKKAVFRFYRRPRIMLGLLREIRSFGQLKIITKRLLNVVAG